MLLSVLLSLVLRANAQEPEAAPAPAANEAAEPVVSIGRAAMWVEERGAASFDASPESLARSADGSSWLLGLADGTLYRSMDGARTWSRVLRAPEEREELDDEEVLLEGESVLDEESERAESESDSVEDAEGTASTDESVVTETDAEASAVDGGDAPREGLDRAETDLDRVSDDPLLRNQDTEHRGAVVWFDPADVSIALAGRSDGIWRSEDGGLHWRRVDPAADAWRFLAVPSMGIVVAGTSNGVRVSPDGGARWFDTVDVTDGLEVRALTLLGDKLLAGTARGLYASTDALRWTRLGYSGSVTGLLPDPSWPGGLWIASRDGIHRSDDAGQTWYTAGRQVMPGLRGVAPLRGQGHLAVWGTDGVWESMDGGVTWHPIYAGLRDRDVRDMVVVRDLPVIASAQTVWRLAVAPTGDKLGGGMGGGGTAAGLGGLLHRPGPISLDEQQLLGLLVDTATRRTGLRLDTLDPRALAIKPLLPTVRVQGYYGWHVGRDSEVLAGQTTELGDGYWEVRALMCFGGCSSDVLFDVADVADQYAGDIGDLSGSLADSVDALSSVYTIDGEVLTEGSESFAATNTAQGIRKYRGQVSDQVVGAWVTLERLSQSAPPPSLAGAVARLLDIEEAEARLDLYTDGAYTRARTPETAP